MPVTKFRTPEEATLHHRSIPGSETNIRRLAFVLEFWSRIHPRKIRRGVFKFRSPQEAREADLSVGEHEAPPPD